VGGRRSFGTVRKRSSGRWQAVYFHDGRYRSSGIFLTKADALASLAAVEIDVRRGAWIDPRAGDVTLRNYGDEWLKNRPDLAIRTRELYRYVLDKHLYPHFGEIKLTELAPSKIRGWHAGLSRDHPATAAKAYRLLSTIMRTAVVDGLLSSSPCKVDGAATERAAERPIATVSEIEGLAKVMPDHLKVVIPLATWCQLRRGEILGLRRKDIDFLHAAINIEQSRTFGMDGKSITKKPKTAAGRRKLAIPAPLLDVLEHHLSSYTRADPDALVVQGRSGKELSRDALQASWEKARLEVGRPDVRLHDLRHTGLTLAAATGATTAELMHRAGHSSAPAALRYQHATQDRDRILADALAEIIQPATVVAISKKSRGKR
jgi:integrase